MVDVDTPTALPGHRSIGAGLNVVVFDDVVEGPTKWVDSPAEVMALIDSGESTSHIVISRGGTTSFVAPVLVTGALGFITLQGAPESHLGILSREYGIPCVMGVVFLEGATNARGEIVPEDGTVVRLGVSGMPNGYIYVKD